MPDEQQVELSVDDVAVVDNVLRDTSTPSSTRRVLVRRASLAVAGVGAAGFLAACGSSKKKTSSSATAPAGGDVQKVIDTAVTAEALAVTYLSGVIKASAGTPVAKFAPVLKAANAEEYDHYKALQSLGARPLTTKFWAPDAFFGGSSLSGVFPTLEVAETLFVNAYLIGMTTFAKAGKPDLARYAGEIGGVEAEHLALARFAQNKLPNDVGFTDYSITSIDGIVSALEQAGVGFGKQGSKPGRFYTFAPPPPETVTAVTNEQPS